jgi:hypothetical protein
MAFGSAGSLRHAPCLCTFRRCADLTGALLSSSEHILRIREEVQGTGGAALARRTVEHDS